MAIKLPEGKLEDIKQDWILAVAHYAEEPSPENKIASQRAERKYILAQQIAMQKDPSFKRILFLHEIPKQIWKNITTPITGLLGGIVKFYDEVERIVGATAITLRDWKGNLADENMWDFWKGVHKSSRAEGFYQEFFEPTWRTIWAGMEMQKKHPIFMAQPLAICFPIWLSTPKYSKELKRLYWLEGGDWYKRNKKGLDVLSEIAGMYATDPAMILEAVPQVAALFKKGGALAAKGLKSFANTLRAGQGAYKAAKVARLTKILKPAGKLTATGRKMAKLKQFNALQKARASKTGVEKIMDFFVTHPTIEEQLVKTSIGQKILKILQQHRSAATSDYKSARVYVKGVMRKLTKNDQAEVISILNHYNVINTKKLLKMGYRNRSVEAAKTLRTKFHQVFLEEKKIWPQLKEIGANPEIGREAGAYWPTQKQLADSLTEIRIPKVPGFLKHREGNAALNFEEGGVYVLTRAKRYLRGKELFAMIDDQLPGLQKLVAGAKDPVAKGYWKNIVKVLNDLKVPNAAILLKNPLIKAARAMGKGWEEILWVQRQCHLNLNPAWAFVHFFDTLSRNLLLKIPYKRTFLKYGFKDAMGKRQSYYMMAEMTETALEKALMGGSKKGFVRLVAWLENGFRNGVYNDRYLKFFAENMGKGMSKTDAVANALGRARAIARTLHVGYDSWSKFDTWIRKTVFPYAIFWLRNPKAWWNMVLEEPGILPFIGKLTKAKRIVEDKKGKIRIPGTDYSIDPLRYFSFRRFLNWDPEKLYGDKTWRTDESFSAWVRVFNSIGMSEASMIKIFKSRTKLGEDINWQTQFPQLQLLSDVIAWVKGEPTYHLGDETLKALNLSDKEWKYLNLKPSDALYDRNEALIQKELQRAKAQDIKMTREEAIKAVRSRKTLTDIIGFTTGIYRSYTPDVDEKIKTEQERYHKNAPKTPVSSGSKTEIKALMEIKGYTRGEAEHYSRFLHLPIVSKEEKERRKGVLEQSPYIFAEVNTKGTKEEREVAAYLNKAFNDLKKVPKEHKSAFLRDHPYVIDIINVRKPIEDLTITEIFNYVLKPYEIDEVIPGKRLTELSLKLQEDFRKAKPELEKSYREGYKNYKEKAIRVRSLNLYHECQKIDDYTELLKDPIALRWLNKWAGEEGKYSIPDLQKFAEARKRRKEVGPELLKIKEEIRDKNYWRGTIWDLDRPGLKKEEVIQVRDRLLELGKQWYAHQAKLPEDERDMEFSGFSSYEKLKSNLDKIPGEYDTTWHKKRYADGTGLANDIWKAESLEDLDKIMLPVEGSKVDLALRQPPEGKKIYGLREEYEKRRKDLTEGPLISTFKQASNTWNKDKTEENWKTLDNVWKAIPPKVIEAHDKARPTKALAPIYESYRETRQDLGFDVQLKPWHDAYKIVTEEPIETNWAFYREVEGALSPEAKSYWDKAHPGHTVTMRGEIIRETVGTRRFRGVTGGLLTAVNDYRKDPTSENKYAIEMASKILTDEDETRWLKQYGYSLRQSTSDLLERRVPVKKELAEKLKKYLKRRYVSRVGSSRAGRAITVYPLRRPAIRRVVPPTPYIRTIQSFLKRPTTGALARMPDLYLKAMTAQARPQLTKFIARPTPERFSSLITQVERQLHLLLRKKKKF